MIYWEVCANGGYKLDSLLCGTETPKKESKKQKVPRDNPPQKKQPEGMQEVIQNTPVHGGDDAALSSLIVSTLVRGGRARSEHLLAGHQKATGNSHCTFVPHLYDPAPALLFLLQEESAAGDDRERRESGGFSGILILLPSKSCCICPAHGP